MSDRTRLPFGYWTPLLSTWIPEALPSTWPLDLPSRCIPRRHLQSLRLSAQRYCQFSHYGYDHGVHSYHHPPIRDVGHLDLSERYAFQPEEHAVCSISHKSVSPRSHSLDSLPQLCSWSVGRPPSCCSTYNRVLQKTAYGYFATLGCICHRPRETWLST